MSSSILSLFLHARYPVEFRCIFSICGPLWQWSMAELTFCQWAQSKINIILYINKFAWFTTCYIVCQTSDKRTQFKEMDLAPKIITFNNSRIFAIARGQRWNVLSVVRARDLCKAGTQSPSFNQVRYWQWQELGLLWLKHVSSPVLSIEVLNPSHLHFVSSFHSFFFSSAKINVLFTIFFYF